MFRMMVLIFKVVFQIVSKDLSDPVRSHKDIDKDAAPYFKKAVKFYEGLAKQLVSQGHVLDLFASALDQVHMRNSFFKICLFSYFWMFAIFIPDLWYRPKQI